MGQGWAQHLHGFRWRTGSGIQRLIQRPGMKRRGEVPLIQPAEKEEEAGARKEEEKTNQPYSRT